MYAPSSTKKLPDENEVKILSSLSVPPVRDGRAGFLRLHPRRATNADCSLQWLAQTQTKASQQS